MIYVYYSYFYISFGFGVRFLVSWLFKLNDNGNFSRFNFKYDLEFVLFMVFVLEFIVFFGRGFAVMVYYFI